MADMPKPHPHGLAIQEGCTKEVPETERFEHKIWTVECAEAECGAKFNIFADIPHYASGEQFGKYVENLLKKDHENKRTHRDYILLPMEAEFTA
jgi:hypothetical protein